MNKREKALLAALAAICLTFLNLSRLISAETSRAGLAERLAAAKASFDPEGVSKAKAVIAEMESLSAEKESAEAAKLDELSLGLAVKTEAGRAGLKLLRYALLTGKNGSFVDMSLSGEPEGIAAFVTAFDGRNGGPAMLSFRASARADRSAVEGSARIGYFGEDEDDGAVASGAAEPLKAVKAAPEAIARLFRLKRSQAPRASSPPRATPAPSPAAAKAVQASWIVFIGRIEETDGRILYYFKDNKAGRSLKLTAAPSGASDGIVSEAEDSLVLRLEGKLYEVRR
jgi:hypothetical protein